MKKTIVSVASDSWTVGQARLVREFAARGENVMTWANRFPADCPPHRQNGILGAPAKYCVPYAFKAYAMMEAACKGSDMILWADACIRPVSYMSPVWSAIEEHGVWICRNGWMNSEWTADSAYPDLFPNTSIEDARRVNAIIPHVVATCFGVDMNHARGRQFLYEYFRLASQTRAFCGPWQNTNGTRLPGVNTDRAAGPCGPTTTLGHRHDQTAASVLAWRYEIPLCDPPKLFAYAGSQTEDTVLIADGSYT